MTFSIVNNKVEKNSVVESSALSILDAEKLNLFFGQGTYNESLDYKKPESFAELSNLKTIQHNTLQNLNTIQETFDRIKPPEMEGKQVELTAYFNENQNEPLVKQGVEIIKDHYEYFQQNFSEYTERHSKNLVNEVNEIDKLEIERTFITDVSNAAKELVDQLNNVFSKVNNTTELKPPVFDQSELTVNANKAPQQSVNETKSVFSLDH